MKNVWGYKADPDFCRRCDRCAELECICGDPAFEAWAEQELVAQARENEAAAS